MSWIDKKYKNHFKEQKYPEGMKHKGWDSMQGLLDKQMPVTAPKSMMSNPLYLSGVAAVVVTVIGIPFFITNQPKDVSPVPEFPTPATIQMSPSDGISISPKTKELKPSDFSTEEIEVHSFKADLAIQAARDNSQQTEADAAETREVENASESIVATPRMSAEPEVNATQVEQTVEESQAEVIADVEVAEKSVAEEVVASNEKEEQESLSREEILAPVAETAVFVVDGTLVEEEPIADEALAEERQISQGEEITSATEITLSEATANEIEGESEEVLEEPTLDKSTAAVLKEGSEENSVAEDENEILAVAETNDAEEQEESSFENLDETMETSSNLASSKAAHLAFLEAEEDLPVPDLLTFSKERFALSVWGAYLFTGKVLSGGGKDDIEKRNAAEKPIYTTPTGVGLDYFVNKNWTVGVGLGWAEYGEDVDYTLYNVTSSIDSVAFDGRYDSPSNYPNIISIDSTRVIDTVNQGHWNYHLSYRNDDSTANSYSGRNTFRYIEVPLTVGYRFGTGRVKPWVKAGVIVGLPVQASYHYPDFETSSYTEGGSKASLSAVQYSGLLQVGADFYINRAISVRLNALGSYQINSMLSNDGVRQRYYRLGASIGVAYNF